MSLADEAHDRAERGFRALVQHTTDLLTLVDDRRWRTVETIANNLLDQDALAGVVLTTRDITDRRELETQLEHQAFHDELTGLANRALFNDRVKHALAVAERADGSVAVLFLDLDDFKEVNDSLGHQAGDQLLVETARRIELCLRQGDTAMYRTKAAGKSSFALFKQSMHAAALLRLELRNELESATARGELSLWYQPIFDLMTGTIAGFEAQLRWTHPRRGIIPPAAFISLAEETGVIVRAGRCELGQGFHLSRPLRPERVEGLLARAAAGDPLIVGSPL